MERAGFYPERISPDSEQFVSDIELLRAPPEFELTEDERAEVSDFEHMLSAGQIPDGIEREVSTSELGMDKLSKITIKSEKICLDYFIQDEVFAQYFTEQGLTRDEKMDRLRRMLSNQSGDGEIGVSKDEIDASKKHERDMIRQNVLKLANGEPYSGDNEPTIFRVIKDTKKLADKLEGLRELKRYYKQIGKDESLSGEDHVAEAKRLMLTLHRERTNTMIAGLYSDGIVALEMSHHRTENHDSGTTDRIINTLPGLKARHSETMAEAAHFMPRERVGRIVSMIDKFMRGVDSSSGYSPITEALEIQSRAPQVVPQVENYVYSDIDPTLLQTKRVDALVLQELVSSVLGKLGILSEHSDHTGAVIKRAPDDKWQAAIDPRERTALGVNSSKKAVMIPRSFDRALLQVRPAGVLPLIDHEIAHVIQNHNGWSLGLELTSNKSTSARTGLWLESGGVVWETVSQEKLFGQLRTTNHTYLRALQERINGGNVSECTWAFIKQRMLEEPNAPIEDMLTHSIAGTLRLFAKGGEWTLGGNYWSNSAPLEYAEQKIIADSIPEDMRYVFYIGRVNLTTLAQLHRIGWIRKEDLLIPDKLPSELIQPEIEQLLRTK